MPCVICKLKIWQWPLYWLGILVRLETLEAKRKAGTLRPREQGCIDQCRKWCIANNCAACWVNILTCQCACGG